MAMTSISNATYQRYLSSRDYGEKPERMAGV